MKVQKVFEKYRRLCDKLGFDDPKVFNHLEFFPTLERTVTAAIVYCKTNNCRVEKFSSIIHNYGSHSVDTCKGFKIKNQNKFFICGNFNLKGDSVYELFDEYDIDPANLVIKNYDLRRCRS
jgi:hypothetical protein